jgi:molecular chaperone DnaK
MGGIMTPLIQRNTTIPTRKSEVFSTASDNQTSVEVHVVQGERPLARDNRTLGRFHLVGLPPAPRGVPQIEVTFDIDANGIVNVSAKDLGTQKEQKITITASSGLSKDEVERMMREAEANSDADKKRREEIEIRNRADQSLYTAERMIKDAGEKIPISDKNAIENAMAELKKAIDGNDTAGMSRAMDVLMQAQHKASEALYKNQQSDAGAQGAQSGQGAEGAQGAQDAQGAEQKSEGDVIDAEVVEDDKK